MLNQNPETLKMVRDITDHLNRIACGEYWYCRNCGYEYHKSDTDIEVDEENIGYCPECEEELDTESMWDYFDENLGEEYTVTDGLDYKGCRICVAWGGPGIWIDTMTKKVELAWWGDNAEAYLSRDAIDEIDRTFEEKWEMILDGHGVKI